MGREERKLRRRLRRGLGQVEGGSLLNLVITVVVGLVALSYVLHWAWQEITGTWEF